MGDNYGYEDGKGKVGKDQVMFIEVPNTYERTHIDNTRNFTSFHCVLRIKETRRPKKSQHKNPPKMELENVFFLLLYGSFYEKRAKKYKMTKVVAAAIPPLPHTITFSL